MADINPYNSMQLKASSTNESDKITVDEYANCTMAGLLDSYAKNAFHVMGKVSNTAETLKEFPAENADEL